MTIATELTTLASTKAAIKAAIEAKGQDLTGVNFAGYAPKIEAISGGSTPAPYVRPTDWLALPDVTGQQKFVGLHAIYPDSNFCALLAEGDYTVDWGDGTVENIASGVQANHQYNYSTFDVANATLCSRGYKQAIVTVTPQAGQNLTTLNLHKKHTMAGLQMYSSGFLDIAISGSLLTSLLIGVQTAGAATQVIIFTGLEQVTLLDNAVTTFSYMFSNCYSLQSIPLIDTSAGTNFSYMFRACYSLQSIPLLDTSAGTDFSSMFQYCSSLQSIPLLDTSAGTDFSSMFSNCSSLQSIPLLDTSAGTDFSSMFQYCSSLQSIPLLDTSAGTTFSGMFSICSSLQSIPLIDTSAGTNFSGMFGTCSSLQSIPLLDTSAGAYFNYMFNNCSSLQSIPLLDTSAGTDLTNMFSICPSLSQAALSGAKDFISYLNCKLSADALNTIYTNLATVTGQTITVTGNWGVASDNPTIATAKGWTVTG